MLIKKGFAWGILDEKGELVQSYKNEPYLTFPTRKEARQEVEFDVERVVRIKIEIIEQGGEKK